MVVEDHDGLRTATVAALNLAGHHVQGVFCAEEVPEAGGPFDIYIVDVGLPGESGFQLVQRIRHLMQKAGIIMLTARSGSLSRIEGYDCGADLYLQKPVSQEELIAAVRSLWRRINGTEDNVDGKAWRLDTTARTLLGPTGRVALTASETKLMMRFALSPERTLERWEAIEALSTGEQEPSPRSLEVRIATLRKKICAIDTLNETHLISIRNLGYRFCAPILFI